MTSGTPILREPEIAEEHFKLLSPRRSARHPKEVLASMPLARKTSQRNESEPIHSLLDGDSAELRRIEEEARDAGFQVGRQAGYQEGHESGFAAGHEAGTRSGDAEGREAYTSGLHQLEVLTQSLNRTVELSLNEAEDMMVSIVFESICKIVGDTLATKDGVAAVVREALGRTRGKSALIIRVNPLDLELIEEGAAFGVASEADWRADDSVTMGGCIVESEYGTLDARIDVQLNQLKRTLLAARHKPADNTEND